MSDIKLPWPEKYRPKLIKEMILPASIKGYFTKKINAKEVSNMLIYSYQPGSGKTSIAKAFCYELGIDYLYINISLDNGVDTLRDNVTKYASAMSFNDNLKVVILDEFDGASPALQKGLRVLIEEYAEVCRFILICNNITQVIDAIKSRCEPFQFSWSDAKSKEEMIPKVVKRMCGILKNENIQFDQQVVEKIVNDKFPDIRSMIVLFEKYSSMYGVINSDILNFKAFDDELIKLIISKQVTQARKYIIEREYDINDLFRFLFDGLVPLIEDKDKKGRTMLTINNYMINHAIAIDKEINFAALLVELSAII